MKTIQLRVIPHDIKIGHVCAPIEPNVTEDSLFVDADTGKPIGFYLRAMPEKMKTLATIANLEVLSERVPKSFMDRKRLLKVNDDGTKTYRRIRQWSAIIGSIPPKPHMRRPYPMTSSVHQHKSATNFVKAMLLLAKEGEELIRTITPEIYSAQEQAIQEHVPEQWRFGRLFTSSITNCNIAADYHRDDANLKPCVNIIIAKRRDSTGGNTTIPDYGATVDSADDSMLVYPAWRNVHGVTPIVPIREGGYRNSLVFYSLKAFSKFMDAS
jgi:hypothetical protein